MQPQKHALEEVTYVLAVYPSMLKFVRRYWRPHGSCEDLSTVKGVGKQPFHTGFISSYTRWIINREMVVVDREQTGRWRWRERGFAFTSVVSSLRTTEIVEYSS